MTNIRRGEMWLVDFGKSDKLTSRQMGIRPAIIVANNMAAIHSPVLTVIPLSTNIRKCKLPTHVMLSSERDGILKPSYAMAEQIQTIDKTDMIKKLATITDQTMHRVENAIMIQLGLGMQQINTNVI